MDAYLAKKGRRLIGWDEILEGGLAPGATVMSWRGEQGGIAAAKSGHDVVMAPNPFTYFDFYQGDPKTEPLAIGGMLPLSKAYSFEPIPAALTAEEAKHVLGAQGQVWTEYIDSPAKVEYMAFPRLSALSEVLWSPKEGKSYDKFLARLRPHLERLRAMGVKFRELDK
jgi:hexosaminidase